MDGVQLPQGYSHFEEEIKLFLTYISIIWAFFLSGGDLCVSVPGGDRKYCWVLVCQRGLVTRLTLISGHK